MESEWEEDNSSSYESVSSSSYQSSDISDGVFLREQILLQESNKTIEIQSDISTNTISRPKFSWFWEAVSDRVSWLINTEKWNIVPEFNSLNYAPPEIHPLVFSFHTHSHF